MYSKTINIEANCMIDMASKQIIPAVIKFSKSLADTVKVSKEIGAAADVTMKLLDKVNGYLRETSDALTKLQDEVDKAKVIKTNKEKAIAYRDKVKVAMAALRKPADELEKITDKDMWPFPTYEDLLFEV
jgi:glutamine synthetase